MSTFESQRRAVMQSSPQCSVPLHLLSHPRHSLGAQQFRYHSTLLGRRAYQSARLVRYYIGPATARHQTSTTSQFPTRIESIRTKKLARYLRQRFINCYRALANDSTSHQDSDKTKRPVEKPKAEAQQESHPLTHLDRTGAAHMVEITGKAETERIAVAVATLLFSRRETLKALNSQQVVKGNAEAVSRLAAIQAAKKTSDLIPLAHPSIGITAVSVDIEIFGSDHRRDFHRTWIDDEPNDKLILNNGGVTITSTVKCYGRTGVEMEALTASTMGAVAMYDMLKAIDKGMVIMGARVIKKDGGKSGGWIWDQKKNKYEQMKKVGRQTATQGNGQQQTAEQPSHQRGESTKVPNTTEAVASPRGSSSPDIDEWNQGLTREFSTFHTNTDGAARTRSPSSANGFNIPKNQQLSNPLNNNTRASSPSTTSDHDTTTSENDILLNITPKDIPPTALGSLETTVTQLESTLHQIRNSPFIQNLLQDRYTRALPNEVDEQGNEIPRRARLDRREEWNPYTMTPISQEDVTADQEKITTEDFREWVRRRAAEGEEGYDGAGSIIQ